MLETTKHEARNTAGSALPYLLVLTALAAGGCRDVIDHAPDKPLPVAAEGKNPKDDTEKAPEAAAQRDIEENRAITRSLHTVDLSPQEIADILAGKQLAGLPEHTVSTESLLADAQQLIELTKQDNANKGKGIGRFEISANKLRTEQIAKELRARGKNSEADALEQDMKSLMQELYGHVALSMMEHFGEGDYDHLYFDLIDIRRFAEDSKNSDVIKQVEDNAVHLLKTCKTYCTEQLADRITRELSPARELQHLSEVCDELQKRGESIDNSHEIHALLKVGLLLDVRIRLSTRQQLKEGGRWNRASEKRFLQQWKAAEQFGITIADVQQAIKNQDQPVKTPATPRLPGKTRDRKPVRIPRIQFPQPDFKSNPRTSHVHQRKPR